MPRSCGPSSEGESVPRDNVDVVGRDPWVVSKKLSSGLPNLSDPDSWCDSSSGENEPCKAFGALNCFANIAKFGHCWRPESRENGQVFTVASFLLKVSREQRCESAGINQRGPDCTRGFQNALQ